MSNPTVNIQGPPAVKTFVTSTKAAQETSQHAPISDITTSGHRAGQSYSIGTGLGVALGVSGALLLLGLLWVLYWVWWRPCPTSRPENVEAENVRGLSMQAGDVRIKQQAMENLIRRPSIRLKRLSRPFKLPRSPRKGRAGAETEGINLTQTDDDEAPLVGLNEFMSSTRTEKSTINYNRASICTSPTWEKRGKSKLHRKPAPKYDTRYLAPPITVPYVHPIARDGISGMPLTKFSHRSPQEQYLPVIEQRPYGRRPEEAGPSTWRDI